MGGNDIENKYLSQIKTLLNTGFFHIFSSSVLNKILAFLSNIIVVRLVSKIDFGIYSYAFNILSIILLVSGLGLVSGTFQLCSEVKGKEKEDIFRYGATIGIKINIVLCFVIVIIAELFQLKISGAKELLLLMCLNPLLIIVFEFQQIYLRSRLENKKYSYATTINTVLVVMGSIIGVFILGIKGLIYGRYIAYILTALIIAYFFKANIGISKKHSKIDSDTKRLLFKISIISMCNNGIAELLYLLDIFILGIFLSDESIIASYKVATVIPTACTFIPMAVITYIYPYFAAHKDDKMWTLKNYKRVVKGIGAFNFFVAAFLFVFAKPILSIIYGNQYIDAVVCFRILAVNYFFAGTFRIISGNLLVTQRKLMFGLIVNIICGIVNIIGNVLLIGRWASIGAALTTFMVVLISSITSTAYYVYTVKEK